MLKTQELVLYDLELNNAAREELVTAGPVVATLGQKLLIEGITEKGFKSNIDFLKAHVMPQLHSFVAGDRGAALGSKLAQGIVIGSIQSGKTVSFSALVALAFDNGATCAVVISGRDTNLHNQTLGRLNGYFKNCADIFSTLEFVKDQAAPHRARIARNAATGIRKTIIVAKKEDQHLEDLVFQLQAIDIVLPATEPPKVIIIDDEGDEASLNGLASKVRYGVQRTTTINRLIKSSCERRSVAGYVAYTATAYANAVSETDSLVFPKGFVAVLAPGEGYLGLKEMFDDPSGDLVETFPDELKDGGYVAIEAAVARFVLACEVRGKNLPDVGALPASGGLVMGVFAGQPQRNHLRAEAVVLACLDSWEENPEKAKVALGRALGGFIPAARQALAAVVAKSEDWIAPRVAAIKMNIKILNEKTKVSIDFKTAPDTIVIGGQLLGRGYTLPRLVSYVLVPSQEKANADTLQQRARFLGYRNDTRAWLRVWMSSSTQVGYKELCSTEAFFRKEALALQHAGAGLQQLTPFLVMQKYRSPTSKNKIARGKSVNKIWWTSRIGTDRTPSYIEALADRILRDGNDGLRNSRYLRISEDEARTLVAACIAEQPADHEEILGGLYLSIGPEIDRDPNPTITAYVMSKWETGRERSLRDGEIAELFMGRSSNQVDSVSERDIFDVASDLTIQLHRMQVEGTKQLGVALALRAGSNKRSLFVVNS